MKYTSPVCAWTRSSIARWSRHAAVLPLHKPPSASVSIVMPTLIPRCAGAMAIAAMTGKPGMSHDLGTSWPVCLELRRLHHKQLHRERRMPLRAVAPQPAPEPAHKQHRSPRRSPPTLLQPIPAPLRRSRRMKQQANATGPSQPIRSRVIRTAIYLMCVDFEHRQLG